MDLSQFRHEKKIHIRYDDLDTFNHVNNKAYLAYLEESRIDLHQKIFRWKEQLEIGALVARIEIDYMKPLFYGNKLSIYTRLSEIRTKSFKLESIFVIENSQTGEQEIASKAKVVLVYVDFKTGKSIEIPEQDRKMMIEYDKI